MFKRSIALWLLLMSPVFSAPSLSAPLKTVMADYSGAIKWPLSMILPGAFSAHSVFTTNLYVNGTLFVPTTNYILVVSGVASNQIGSLTAPIDVSDDPQPNEALMFNGVTAEWISASNMIFNGDSVFSGITLGGQKITSWSDITNEATVITGDIIANSVDAPIIQGTVGSFSNLLAPVVSAEELVLNNISITNWSDITNGMLTSGGDLAVNSITSGTVIADSIIATNVAASSISSTQFILNSVAISDWSSITGSADWARSAASTNINAGGNEITNASKVVLSDGTIISSDISASSITCSVVQATWINASNVTAPIVSAAEMILDGVSITNWSNITNGALIYGSDIYVNSVTAKNVTATDIAATNVTVATLNVDSMVFNGTTITNINQSASNYIPYSYSSFSVMDSTGQVSAVQMDARYGKARIEFRNAAGAGKIEFASNTFYFSSASSNDIIVNSGVLATGTPIYAESDPLWEAARQSVADMLVVNASNIMAPVVSAEEFILNGSPITDWSSITGHSDWAKTAASTNIDAGNHDVTNVSGIYLGGIRVTSWGDISNRENWAKISAVTNIDAGGHVISNLSGIILSDESISSWAQLTNRENWAVAAAAVNVDIGGNDVTNVAAIRLSDGTVISSDIAAGSLTCSAIQAIWVNSSNVTAPVISADELVLNGIGIIDWSSITGSADWARSAASTNIDAGNHDLTNVAGIYLDGVRVTSWGEVTNRDNWSAAAATTNANIGGHNITNAKNITASGYISAGAITSSSISIDALSLSSESITSWAQLTNRENWSADAASEDVDAGGNSITNASEIILSDGSVLSADLAVGSLTCSVVQTTWLNSSNITSPIVSAEELILDGVGVTSWSSITGSSDWARSPASSDVDFGDHYITNLSGIYISDYLVTNWAQLTNMENWSRSPADGNVNIGGHYITNISAISLDGVLITNWSELTNTANWSLTAASEDINAGGNSITNLLAIFLNDIGITNWAQLTNRANWSADAASGDVNAGGNYITNLSAIYLDNIGITSWAQLTNRANWAADAASGDVDIGGNSITNFSAIYLNNVGVTDWSQLTNRENWSADTAVGDVDIGDNDLLNVSSISMSGGAHIAGDTAVGSLTCSLVQATVINSSNVTSGVVSADEIIINGDAKTAWPDPADWSASAAANDIDAGGHAITNLSGISIGSGLVTNWSDIASIYSTNLNLVTNTVFIDNANVNGFSLTNVGTLYFQGGGSITASGGVFEFGE